MAYSSLDTALYSGISSALRGGDEERREGRRVLREGVDSLATGMQRKRQQQRSDSIREQQWGREDAQQAAKLERLEAQESEAAAKAEAEEFARVIDDLNQLSLQVFGKPAVTPDGTPLLSDEELGELEAMYMQKESGDNEAKMGGTMGALQ